MYVVKIEDAGNSEEFGFKAAGLARMLRAGLPVPKGFVITPQALDLFISRNGLEDKIRSVSENNGHRGLNGLRNIETRVKDIFLSAMVPAEVKKEVLGSYKQLPLAEEVRNADIAAIDLIRSGRDHERVAVRSSVIRQPDNSYAGILDTFLNVSGEDQLWSRIKLCWASIFYPYALLYSETRDIQSLPRMAIIVQKMVDSEKAGVIFVNFGNDKVLIEGSWGLGNAVSSGIVTPDEYLLHRNGVLIEKNISKKLWQYSRNPMTGKTEKEHVPGSKLESQVLTEPEMRKLCELAAKVLRIEPGQYLVDFGISRNRVFILDWKPGIYHISKTEEEYSGDVLVTGRCTSPGTATGQVSPFLGGGEGQPERSSIVVSENPDNTVLLAVPDISGFVTDNGGRLCNFGILARELSIPVLTATNNATTMLHMGNKVRLMAEHGKVISASTDDAESEEIDVPSGGDSGALPPGFDSPEPGFPSGPPMPDFGAPDEGTGREVTGTKLFARVHGNRVEPAADVDGYVVLNTPEQVAGMPGIEPVLPSGADSIMSLGASHVWLQPRGESDFNEIVEIARRLEESGFSGHGVLVPVTRGIDDLERMRQMVPVGAKLGVLVKTPAMSVNADSFVRVGVKLVVIDLDTLIQLSMGLSRPDREIHPAVIHMVKCLHERCRDIGAKVSVNLGSDYVSEENIEAFVRIGVDSISVESDHVRQAKDALSRAERRVLLEKGSRPESEYDEQPYEPESGQEPGASAFQMFETSSDPESGHAESGQEHEGEDGGDYGGSGGGSSENEDDEFNPSSFLLP